MLIENTPTLTFIAASAEYGHKMKSACPNAEIIGVGPIEAAFNVTRILMKHQHNNTLPKLLFSVGTAGSQTLEQGALYQINRVSYRDMDARAFGFDKGVTPFVNYPAEFQLPVLLDTIPTASLSTGAMIIDKQGSAALRFDDINADCVDMETYSIARIAHYFNIPLIALRGISDGKENAHGIQTWEAYLEIIDTKIAEYYGSIKIKYMPKIK